MIISDGLLVISVAAVIYVSDSVHLLYNNEALVIQKKRNQFCVFFADNGITLAGRELYIPNPLSPHRAAYKVKWGTHCVPKIARDRRALLRRVAADTGILAPFAWSIFIVLFLLLPTAIFLHLDLLILLAWVALAYLYAIAALVIVFVKRKSWGLDNSRFAKLVTESLLCIPCAINMIRKIAYELPIPEDLTGVSRGLLNKDGRKQFVNELKQHVDQQLSYLEGDSSETYRSLRSYRAQLDKIHT